LLALAGQPLGGRRLQRLALVHLVIVKLVLVFGHD
jgi:hypothetical protein